MRDIALRVAALWAAGLLAASAAAVPGLFASSGVAPGARVGASGFADVDWFRVEPFAKARLP